MYDKKKKALKKLNLENCYAYAVQYLDLIFWGKLVSTDFLGQKCSSLDVLAATTS